MDLEASPRQLIDRSAATPVERQEASRFAGGRASDLVTFYEDRPRAPSACEVGDRGAIVPPRQITMLLRELIPLSLPQTSSSYGVNANRSMRARPLCPGSALHLETAVFFWMHLSSAISRKARLRIIRTSYIIRMTTPQSAAVFS